MFVNFTECDSVLFYMNDTYLTNKEFFLYNAEVLNVDHSFNYMNIFSVCVLLYRIDCTIYS